MHSGFPVVFVIPGRTITCVKTVRGAPPSVGRAPLPEPAADWPPGFAVIFCASRQSGDRRIPFPTTNLRNAGHSPCNGVTGCRWGVPAFVPLSAIDHFGRDFEEFSANQVICRTQAPEAGEKGTGKRHKPFPDRHFRESGRFANGRVVVDLGRLGNPPYRAATGLRR
jgi:hypothetical protein